MDSILDSTKKVLGIDAAYTAFDYDVTMLINAAFSTLHQLGVGPTTGFAITGKTEKWSDFFEEVDPTLNNVQAYVFLSVRLAFDPPQSGYATSAFQKQLEELAWRLNMRVEEKKYPWTEPIVLGRRLPIEVDDEVNFG